MHSIRVRPSDSTLAKGAELLLPMERCRAALHTQIFKCTWYLLWQRLYVEMLEQQHPPAAVHVVRIPWSSRRRGHTCVRWGWRATAVGSVVQ